MKSAGILLANEKDYIVLGLDVDLDDPDGDHNHLVNLCASIPRTAIRRMKIIGNL